MNTETTASPATKSSHWSQDVHREFASAGISLVATVPDGGLVPLLQLCEADDSMQVVTLTTEEEGIALCSGAWLGGLKAIMLMQSSGVGNCINMLSLPNIARIPLLMVITMRGEWGEFNPWQVPMGQATPAVLQQMGVTVYRPDTAVEIGATVAAAGRYVFATGNAAAVLVSQRIIGAKSFTE
jgi:sulfopyruvate decarboxylase alpha subunit